MRKRMLAAMAASAVVITGAGSTAAEAAQAVRVPCNTASLIAAISGAGGKVATVSLTHGCAYVLTAALPVITGDLSIAGNGATLKRSTAPGTPAFSILTLAGNASLAVGELNFRNGGGSAGLDGGAIYSIGGGSLSIYGGNFTGNSAGNGGAIASFLTAPGIQGAVFTGNSAAEGGAVFNYSFTTGLWCGGCAFRDNTATGNGGAVFDRGGNDENLSGSTFAGNTAGGDGGALWLSQYGADSLSATFRSNRAGGDGGAIYVKAGGPGVGITRSFMAWNTAGGNGGAIYDGSTVAFLSEDTITANRAAGDGGGLDNGPGSSAVLTGTTVTANRAPAGGGIYDTGPESSTDLESSPVTGNKPGNCAPLGSIAGCTG